MGNVEKVNNDATKKLQGFDYQKLIALEVCFEAKPDDIIWLECKGDVSDGETTIEVKHHFGNDNLTSNSTDVWKTLKNYVLGKYNTAQHTSLVLHTTANIKEDSIFYDWSSLTPNEKYKKLIDHKPSETIKDFYQVIISDFAKEPLLEILEKFKIISSQPKIKEKWQKLKNDRILTLVKDEYKERALQELYGYITKKAIDDNNEWKVTKKDFDRDIKHSLSKYTQGSIAFPVVDNSDLESKLNHKGYHFVSEMKSIQLKETNIDYAVSDYLRANLSQFKLIEESPTIKDRLETYDRNIRAAMNARKNENGDDLQAEHLNTDVAYKASRKTYYASINSPCENIRGIDQTEPYYQKGRMHDAVEEKEFSWKYSEEDL